MITPYIIDSTSWTQITLPGQNGSCWLDEENDDVAGQANIRIYHQVLSLGVPSDAKITTGKRIYKCSGNNDSCGITADSGTDIYYARCVTAGDQVTLIVDVV